MSAGELLFFGGDIHTVDDWRPAAEAVAVRDGLIAAVGSVAECESALSEKHEKVDLAGRTMLPGFIDTHLHPLALVYFEMNVDLRDARSMDDIIRSIRSEAGRTNHGSWVVGLQLEEQNLREKRLPTRHDLDDAAPSNPVAIIKHDGHTVVANTAAIEACGVTSETPDPEGGLIDREPDGFPAGIFREEASTIIKDRIPIPDVRAFMDGAESAFGRLASCGVTSIGAVMQAGAEGPMGAQGVFELPLIQLLLERIPINLYGLLVTDDIEKVREARKTPLHTEEPGAGHRIGAVKIFADGTFGSCTAYMLEPFADNPGTRGFLARSEEELYSRMAEGHDAGLQVAVHAIGDAANRTVIDLFDRLLREHPLPGHRHRIEHASQLDAGMIEDIARLGLVVSTQPQFIHSEKDWLTRRLGPERTPWTYPFRSLLEAGATVAGASDGPIESVDVLHAIQICVTREGFETGQCVTAEQAVRMYTLDAAYAQFEERFKGSISPGKRADLVILSGNPVAVDPHEIAGIEVEATVCGGRVIYGGFL